MGAGPFYCHTSSDAALLLRSPTFATGRTSRTRHANGLRRLGRLGRGAGQPGCSYGGSSDRLQALFTPRSLHITSVPCVLPSPSDLNNHLTFAAGGLQNAPRGRPESSSVNSYAPSIWPGRQAQPSALLPWCTSIACPVTQQVTILLSHNSWSYAQDLARAWNRKPSTAQQTTGAKTA